MIVLVYRRHCPREKSRAASLTMQHFRDTQPSRITRLLLTTISPENGYVEKSRTDANGGERRISDSVIEATVGDRFSVCVGHLQGRLADSTNATKTDDNRSEVGAAIDRQGNGEFAAVTACSPSARVSLTRKCCVSSGGNARAAVIDVQVTRIGSRLHSDCQRGIAAFCQGRRNSAMAPRRQCRHARQGTPQRSVNGSCIGGMPVAARELRIERLLVLA